MTQTKRNSKNTRKTLKLNVPDKVYNKVYNLLWLDRSPEKIKIAINNRPILDIVLTQIMLQLGADLNLLNTKCFVICGPTGVGKTKFINNLKEKYNVETINMDTMQVYSTISVGTGRTNLANTKGSHIYGTYNPNKEFHIVNYLVDVFKAVKQITENKNVPVFEGASKSILSVLMRIFPNLVIFGIKAVNDQNIVDNITKRISTEFVKDALIELSNALQNKQIKFTSPVLTTNWVVYNLLITNFTSKELMSAKFKENIEMPENIKRIESLTTKCVKANIRLHKQQIKNLLRMPNIIWFNNSVDSVKLLEKQYVKLSGMRK